MKKEYITVHGKQYNSYVAISHDYDVEVQELLRYVNAGYSAEEAVAQCRNACRRGTDRKAYRIELDGAAYASLSEACRKIGISTSSTYQKKKAIMQQTGVSEHEATIQALQYLSARRTEKRGGRAEKVVIAGHTYPSRHAAIQAYHLSTATVHARITRAKQAGKPISFEEALLAGRNRKYAAARYGMKAVELQGDQSKLLEYLGGELRGESFHVVFYKKSILHASRQLPDDLQTIALTILWATETTLSICWSSMVSVEALGDRKAALKAVNRANSMYVGIKLSIQPDDSIGAICDTYVSGSGIASRKSTLVAVRQFIETCSMLLVQWGAEGSL